MKKQSDIDVHRQKLQDVKARNKKSKDSLRKIENRRQFRRQWHVPMPTALSACAPKYRQHFIQTIEMIKKRASRNEPCYLDFNAVQVLLPDGAIYLYNILDKLHSAKLTGRMSKNKTVKAMMTKLNFHQRMNLRPFSQTIPMVDRWLVITGQSADLGTNYDIIEAEIVKMIPSKIARIRLQNAISEAVTNVVNHAYDTNAKYKRWVLFFSVQNDKCAIVISDLGKTIPVTVPIKLKDKIQQPLSFWNGSKDSVLIDIATRWRKTATDQSYRGKGFDDIIMVEDVFNDTQVYIASRKGVWSSNKGAFDYSDTVFGTIVSWVIPVNNDQLTLKV